MVLHFERFCAEGKSMDIPNNSVTYKRIGVLFILMGILLLIDTIIPFKIYSLWPLLLTGTGIGFLRIFRVRKSRDPLFIVLGLMFFQCSLLFLYCSIIGWGEMLTLWPLFIGFIGTVYLTNSYLVRKKRLLVFMGLLHLSIMAVFLLVFSVSSSLWWTLFIFTGISILIPTTRQ